MRCTRWKRLRHLPFPSSDDPRIDYIEARAWVNNDVVKAQAAARRASKRGTPRVRNFSSHEPTEFSVRSAMAIPPPKIVTMLERATQQVGDRDNAARTTSDFAILYYEQGDLDRSEAMYREAIQVFRQVGDLEGVTTTSGNLGDIYLARGNLTEAARALSDAIPGYKEMGDKDGVALTVADLAKIARLRGDLESSACRLREARAIAGD
jgi:tetratricopeptide (TPR) repeat protein